MEKYRNTATESMFNHRHSDEVPAALEYLVREGLFTMVRWNELSHANRAMIRLLGYDSIEDYNSREARSIFGDTEDEGLIRARLDAGETIINHRTLLKTKGNGNVWGLLSCVPIEASYTYCGAVIDISGLVENERSLRDNAHALAKSNMELDRFIYSASHDIRSPISTVMGLINLIHLETERDKQMHLVGLIASTMKKLDFFLHQLGSHSRNARRGVQVSRINFDSLLDNVLNELSGLASIGPVEISRSIQCQDFHSDSERLATILFNILKNAVDFADPLKKKRKIDILAEVVRNRLMIEIFDNGIGISDDRVPNVFDMFYKASDRSVGSGLGLYLVRETVTRLNGIVSLYSRLGIGTMVRVEIPNSL